MERVDGRIEKNYSEKRRARISRAGKKDRRERKVQMSLTQIKVHRAVRLVAQRKQIMSAAQGLDQHSLISRYIYSTCSNLASGFLSLVNGREGNRRLRMALQRMDRFLYGLVPLPFTISFLDCFSRVIWFVYL